MRAKAATKSANRASIVGSIKTYLPTHPEKHFSVHFGAPTLTRVFCIRAAFAFFILPRNKRIGHRIYGRIILFSSPQRSILEERGGQAGEKRETIHMRRGEIGLYLLNEKPELISPYCFAYFFHFSGWIYVADDRAIVALT